METLVVAVAALVALVLIDAGHWIAVSLVRWSPIIIVGAAAGWLADRQGLSPAEAAAVAVLTSVIARFAMHRLARARYDEDRWY